MRLRPSTPGLARAALPTGTMMPLRGGNDALSDDDVRAAVDYMVRLVAR